MLQGVRWFDPCWCMADADEAQELLWGAGHATEGLCVDWAWPRPLVAC
jgi:hypothetical protein